MKEIFNKSSIKKLRSTSYSKKILSKIFKSRIFLSLIGIMVVCLMVLIFFCTSPSDFPSDTTINIKSGSTLSETAKILSDNHIIRSQFLYKVAVVLIGSSKNIVQGKYSFADPESVLRVAYRTVKGQYGFTPIKVTIPEGYNSNEIANLLAKYIPDFDVAKFKTLARPNEGYLFPDTYYFYKITQPEDVVSQMKDNFNEKIAPIYNDLSRFGKKTSDIIIMASIVEKESTDRIDRRIVAGILWKRLDKGMPLQVDAPFYYILNKASGQLTVNDLATTSSYNLYKKTGLTPMPISNPGLEAIEDTITPTPTPYLYFLSDNDGTMHYGANFDDHIANKQKYLQ